MRSRLKSLPIHGSIALMAMLAACSEPIAPPVADVALSSATTDQHRGGDEKSDDRRRGRVRCDADNGGITLPAGFCAVVVADRLGAARHMAVTPNGDV